MFLVILNQNEMSISPNVGALNESQKLKEFFESMNFDYDGIVDGYDIPLLIEKLNKIKDQKNPMVLHIKTTKGKGYFHAEKEPSRFHNPFYPFNKDTGEFEKKFIKVEI